MEEREGEEDQHGCSLDDIPRSLLSIYFNQTFVRFESGFDESSGCPAFYLELEYPHSIVPAFLVHFGSLFGSQNLLDIPILYISDRDRHFTVIFWPRVIIGIDG